MQGYVLPNYAMRSVQRARADASRRRGNKGARNVKEEERAIIECEEKYYIIIRSSLSALDLIHGHVMLEGNWSLEIEDGSICKRNSNEPEKWNLKSWNVSKI